MKKLLTAFLSVVLTVMLLWPIAAAEELQPAYRINEVRYDGHMLYGNAVFPPGGTYYARITFVLGDRFIVIVVPVKANGDFTLPIAVCYDGYAVEIIDQNSADVPRKIYAWYSRTLNADK